ncbi:hypothetical protein U9M48_011469 [Paspalum notatum var. saurae]|uniref:F-box protein AT5G49610-like beta-propeller domain-containing protein n=1 Tax=Paspalum notatum var. saurae TaxID=547442 RepID=A0AAQ3SVT6_PASNO
MLGFICNCRFIPVCTFRPPDANNRVGLTLDARHGRAFIGRNRYDSTRVLVWDPTTDERWKLPPSPHADPHWGDPNEAMLCAATGSGACDHLDCHGGHFIVVSVVNTINNTEISLCVYSSEAGVWSKPTTFVTDRDYFLDRVPSALAGNTLCFSAAKGTHALMYDLAAHEAYFISLPQPLVYLRCATALVTMKDGGLGVAQLDESATLSLWSLGVIPDGDVGMAWTQIRVIELDKLLPAKAHSIWPAFVGFTHDVGVFFLGTDDGLFTFDLLSGEVRKVCEEACGRYGIGCVFPYMSFYTPELVTLNDIYKTCPQRHRVTFADEGPGVGASSTSKTQVAGAILHIKKEVSRSRGLQKH